MTCQKARPTIFALTFIATAFLSTGCTAAAPPDLADDMTSSPTLRTAQVEVGDITPVITLAAGVAGPVSFQITSDFDGVLTETQSGVFAVVDASGQSHPLSESPHQLVTPLLPPGASVVEGLPVATATFGSFALVAPIQGVDLARMVSVPDSARAQVDGGGAPFPCALLDERPSTSSTSSLGGEQFIACAIPADQSVIVGMTGVIALQFGTRSDVLTLPLEAVAGSFESGSVYLKRGDEAIETEIRLGAADALNVELLSGLAEGDEVYIPSPDLLNE
jgi:hypothetical protein